MTADELRRKVEGGLPEPAATIYRLTEALRNDLAYAAPELWPLHIERRLAQAYEAGMRATTVIEVRSSDGGGYIASSDDPQIAALGDSVAAALRGFADSLDALTETS